MFARLRELVTSPVERPLHEELPRRLREIWPSLMRFQAAIDDALQPQRPPLEPALLLQGLLELALEVQYQTGFALADPRGL